MENLKRKDGTYLTDEEMMQLQKELEDASKPVEDYLKINQLEEGIFLSVLGNLIEVRVTERKDNEIIFDLRYNEIIFENQAKYVLSKSMEENKKRVSSYRLIKYLEWLLLKNIDRIVEIDEEYE